MEIEKTAIEGVFIVKPNVFSDNRGYFFESYNKVEFERLGTKSLIFGIFFRDIKKKLSI